MKFLKITLLAIILLVVPSLALGVSFPSAPVPAARFATGFTYDYYGGYLSYGKNTFFEKQDLPVTMHGISAFFTYAPATNINFGFDLGFRDANIYPDKSLTIASGDLNGKLGFSVGPHLKLATPYFSDVMAIIATARGNWFYSEGTGNNTEWSYDGEPITWDNSGYIISAGGGFSFHVKNFGYISFGAKYLDIIAELNIAPASVADVLGNVEWLNDRYIGGWLAFDYFPKTNIKKYLPFISFEIGFFPNDKAFNGENPILRNASFSVTIGAITKRLYGDKNENWRP